MITVTGLLLWKDTVRERGREKKQESDCFLRARRGPTSGALGAVFRAGHTLWVLLLWAVGRKEATQDPGIYSCLRCL